MNALGMVEDLLRVRGMRGCGLDISGVERREGAGCDVRSPSTFSFLVSVHILDASLPFPHAGFEV
jgi:hypothetical protein